MNLLRECYVYTISPIDTFDGMIKLSDYINQLLKDEYGNYYKVDDVLSRMAHASYLFAKHTYWEGDATWYISGVPCPDGCFTELLFMAKQSNNGSVFIASPIKLGHLEENACFSCYHYKI